jgi:urease accessory protein
LKRPAIAGGANAMALLVASAVGVGERCEAVRAALQCFSVDTGVSAWNDLLVVRALASRLDVLQNVLQRAVGALQRCDRPSVWPQ